MSTYVFGQADDGANSAVLVEVGTGAVVARAVCTDVLLLALWVAVNDRPSRRRSEIGDGGGRTAL